MFDAEARAALEAYAQKVDAVDFYGIVRKTDLQKARMLSASLGRNLYLKREDQQPVFSFKIRGAANKMSLLTAAQRQAGVITASAGNHAQGVALAAQKAGVQAVICMPRTTPEIKVSAVRALGGTVVLHGDAFPEALAHALQMADEKGLCFIHPYDDADVIAGQGTIGKEILEQHPGPIDAVFVPVGGGGLLAGVAAWIKAVRPSVKIIGVEPEGSCCLHRALQEGKRIALPQVELFADGVAVAQIGEEPFRLLQPVVDETILVSADEICAAAWDIFGDTRTVPEPAGALGVAGARKYAARQGDATTGALIAVVSGANVDSDRVRYMAERIAVGQKREALLSVVLPETPGSLLGFCRLLQGYAITEFNYRYADRMRARIFVGLRVQNHDEDKKTVLEKLAAGGYDAVDLTESDLAKEHVRHMVGGRPPCPLDEVLYSFAFPERPGALLTFLEKLPPRWNITLFHYRSHGASHGRVLMALDVPMDERDLLRLFMAEGDLDGRDETDNPAYVQFLSALSQKAA